MDYVKIGKAIAALRKEKGFTQRMLADAMHISNKTVSKWECGVGCPDVSLWAALSAILDADMTQLMEGEITANRPDAGNIEKLRFYVCSTCQNVMVGTGSASVFCCGRKLDPAPLKEKEENLSITVQPDDFDYYVTLDHEMSREHTLLFAAAVKYDKYYLVRLYPEQSAAVRIPAIIAGTLYLYCTVHGLSVHSMDS